MWNLIEGGAEFPLNTAGRAPPAKTVSSSSSSRICQILSLHCSTGPYICMSRLNLDSADFSCEPNCLSAASSCTEKNKQNQNRKKVVFLFSKAVSALTEDKAESLGRAAVTLWLQRHKKNNNNDKVLPNHLFCK